MVVWRLGAVIPAVALLGGCGTKPKSMPVAPVVPIVAQKVVTHSLPTPAGYELPPLQALTNLGDNDHPHFSHDGGHLVFDSRNRPGHTQKQIYELTLATLSSRRVTFHPGDASDPAYLPSDQGIIYASTTDELKEDGNFLTRILDRFSDKAKPPNLSSELLPVQELYLSRLDGSLIRRITFSPGFDGRPSPHPKQMRLVFVSNRTGKLELFQTSGNLYKQTALLRSAVVADEPDFSPDGKALAWIEYASDFKTSRVIIASDNGSAAHALPLPAGLYHRPSWRAGGKELVVNATFENIPNAEIYSIDLSRNCLLRLTYDEASDTAPVFRPDGKQIVFASNRSGQYQLYLMDYKPPKDCLNL